MSEFPSLLQLVAIANLLLLYIIYRLQKEDNSEMQDIVEEYSEPIKKLSEALEKATIEKPNIPQFCPVPSIKEIQHVSTCFESMYLVQSYMVCGPRGVGKTTAMLMAFEDTEGVIHIQPDPVTVDNFYDSLMNYAKLKLNGINKAGIVRDALKAIKERGGKTPTLIIEINEKCNPKQLESILIELKKLVPEARLLNCFIVVSTSHASLLVPVTLQELRVATLQIDDPPADVMTKYLHDALSTILDVTPEEREKLIKYYIEEVGTRFLDASSVMTDLALQPTKETFLTEIGLTKSRTLKSCEQFLKLFAVAHVEETKIKELLKGIVNGTLQLSELVEHLKMTRGEFINLMSEIRPHPVYINPKTEMVTAGNFVAQKKCLNI